MDPYREIDPGLWNGVVDTIDLAASEGLKGHPAVRADFKQQLLHNNEVFAAFKVHRLQSDMARQMVDAQGNLKSFEQWAEDVRQIANHQCRQWLRTEYDTAVKRASLAADWQRFEDEKDVLPNLRWIPSTAAQPDAFHQSMWDTVLPVDHPFWSAHHPGDRWGCQCGLEATDDPVTPTPTADYRTSPGLENNPGRDAKLFNETHPYFPDSCDSCPFYGGKLSGPTNKVKDCGHCQFINSALPDIKKPDTKVQTTDRAVIREKTTEWAEKHLPVVDLPNGQKAQRLVVDNNGDSLVVNKKFFSETFAKNIHNTRLAETMDLATKVELWLPSAIKTGMEKGMHHKCDFWVYEATYDGIQIQCKVKDQKEKMVYTMRIK